MNIKHSEIEIPDENPFANCKLGRKKYADVLTNIVNSYSYGFVLAINNKWGTGKTTFVNMWMKILQGKGHKTVYFNAWENDFEDNALTALMGELKTLETKSTELEFKNTLIKTALISKHIAPVIAQAIADKYIDTKIVKDGIDGATKGLAAVFVNNVNEYAEKKKSVAEFKKKLSEFIVKTYQGKPLIFVIDELDRCRPNYAVSILEQIKHFFSVPNVVFVLSIDKDQLGSAIKGVYGSEAIDSEEYLRRFIDLEYSIPEPESDMFYTYLFEYYQFKEFFDSAERKKYTEFQSDKAYFLKICKLLFTKRNISLRQQDKIFGLARVALRSFNLNNYVVPHIFLFLAFVKITDNEYYHNLKNKELTLLQVQEKFLKTVITNKNDDTETELMWLEVYLVNFYQNFLESRHYRKPLYEYDNETGSNNLLIDSVINKEKNSNFLNILENIHRRQSGGDLDLGYFISRLELLENLKT